MVRKDSIINTIKSRYFAIKNDLGLKLDLEKELDYLESIVYELEASKNILPQNPKIKFLISAKIINFCSSFDEILLDNVNEKVTLENG